MAQAEVQATEETGEDIRVVDIRRRDEWVHRIMRCVRTQMIEEEDLSTSDLFAGYDDLRVITFSYDIPMLDWLADRFQFVELIIGGDFMLRKDDKTISKVAECLAKAETDARQLSMYDRLVKRMKDGSLVVKSSPNVVDHRKLYLLRADDGRTRVIDPSANMTRGAWSVSDQIEHVSFDDSLKAYDFYQKLFDSAWDMASNIPYTAVQAVTTSHPEKANAILKKVVETKKAVVIQPPQTDEKAELTIYQYNANIEDAEKKYIRLLKDTGIRKNKDGSILLLPKDVEKIRANIRKAHVAEENAQVKTEDYPRITFDYNRQAMLLNGTDVDLHPSEEEVKAGIRDLLSIFDKYNSFVGTDPQKQKAIYYKLLNAMFASPFFAKLRCESRLIDKGTTSLPLYLLISSSRASTGKSFFVEAVQKMMTGKRDLRVFTANKLASKDAVPLQISMAGTPIFIDEIDNAYLSRLSGAIKTTDQICELRQKDDVPMVIFASNDVTDPDDKIRKRVIFLNPEGTIPSDADQTAWLSAGGSLIARITMSLYREYVRRMIPKVWDMIDQMETNGRDFPDNWYPDIMPLSSETLIDILKDYGFDVPDYFRVLTWYDDFGENAACISADAFQEIRELYQADRKLFSVTKEAVTIQMGSDKDSRRKAESWKSVMPVEILKDYHSGRDGTVISFDRAGLEARIGIRFKKKWFRRR